MEATILLAIIVHVFISSMTRENYVWSKEKWHNDTLKNSKVLLEAIFGSCDTQPRVHFITRTLLSRSLLQRLGTSETFIIISNNLSFNDELKLLTVLRDSKLYTV